MGLGDSLFWQHIRCCWEAEAVPGCGRYFEPYPKGISNGAAAGITIAVLVAFFAAVVFPIAWFKRQKALRKVRERAAMDQSRDRLMAPNTSGDKLERL